MKYAGSATDVAFEVIIEEYFELSEKIERLEKSKFLLYQEIVRVAQESQAELFPTEKLGVVEVKSKVEKYDPTKLSGLREITEPSLLESSGAYTPEHEVVIPETTKVIKERWDARKLGQVGRLGKEHRDIIESAKIFGRHKIKKVEVKSDS